MIRGRAFSLVAVAAMLGFGMGIDCMPVPLPTPRARPRDDDEQPEGERDTLPAPQPCEDAGDGTCIHDHQQSETLCALPGGYRPRRADPMPVPMPVAVSRGEYAYDRRPVVNRSREQARRMRQIARKREKDTKE